MHNRTYRYYTGAPLYKFGFGLSYGDCRVTALKLEGDTAFVTAKNLGRCTENVIELYVKDEKSAFAPPNSVLCGFKRIALCEGEEKTFAVQLSKTAFTVVNDAGERVPGSGEWTLYADFSQPDENSARVTVLN